MEALAKKWTRLRVFSGEAAELRLDHLFLSRNDKTGISVNVDMTQSCTNRTSECARYCYGLGGPIAFAASVKKQRGNFERLQYLETAPQAEVDEEADLIAAQVKLAGQDFLRWNGVGDLTMGAVRVLAALAKRHGWISLWISTRKPELAAKLPRTSSVHVMFSVDKATRPADAAHMRRLVRSSKGQKFLAWAQTEEVDVAPADVTVVFAEHHGAGRANWEPDPRTCGATIREGKPGHVSHEGACAACRRCFDVERRAAQ